ncbi:MAG: DUF981 domain-containing protein [bacterium]
MFIDYVTLLLINMVAGLAVLAHFIYKGLTAEDQRKWAPGFAMTGLVAIIAGLHMTFNWPIIGSYNSAFGECSVLFGIIFLGAALATGKGWGLDMVALYAFFGGALSILIGVRIIDLKMTQMPLLSGAGFILTGLGGVCAYAALRKKYFRPMRIAGSIVMAAAALIWALTAYIAYWIHLSSFSGWVPRIIEKTL